MTALPPAPGVRRATPAEDTRVGALVVTGDDGRQWVTRWQDDAWHIRLLSETHTDPGDRP